jgi:hypothetical protein
VLATVAGDGAASGPPLPGAISFHAVLDAYGQADRPPPATFRLDVTPSGQRLVHTRRPELRLAYA